PNHGSEKDRKLATMSAGTADGRSWTRTAPPVVSRQRSLKKQYGKRCGVSSKRLRSSNKQSCNLSRLLLPILPTSWKPSPDSLKRKRVRESDSLTSTKWGQLTWRSCSAGLKT